MTLALSTNTQAVLLLTAPLIDGRAEASPDLFTAAEYRRLYSFLRTVNLQPGDLLTANPTDLSTDLKTRLDPDRLNRLLGRGFQMTQALERWQSRAIWIVCHTDDEYPYRLKERLREYAPPLIYGCGEPGVLNCGGLAVVGSRAADPWLIEYTEKVGQLAAESGTAIISGGARGIDQAAMRGALGIGGKAVGVMADSLERSAMAREHRDLLLDEKLVLISPYDPLAGFNIGNAMQRNKLIYALADAALVVNSDYEKGGTWAGAVEQLEKLHLVPIYLRSSGDLGEGLQGLSKKGALRWPDPNSTEEFIELINKADSAAKPEQLSLLS